MPRQEDKPMFKRRFEPDDESDDDELSPPKIHLNVSGTTTTSALSLKQTQHKGLTQGGIPTAVPQDPKGAALSLKQAQLDWEQKELTRQGDISTAMVPQDPEGPVPQTRLGRRKTTGFAPHAGDAEDDEQPGAYRVAGRDYRHDSNDSDDDLAEDMGDDDVGPMFAVTAETIPSNEEDEEALRKSRRRRRRLMIVGLILLLAVVGIVVGIVASKKKRDSTPAPSASPTATPMPTLSPTFSPTGRPTLQGELLPLGQTLTGAYEYDRFGGANEVVDWDRFVGTEVAMNANGTILAVGAVGADQSHMTGNRTGRVYVYQLIQGQTTTQWRPLGQVLESDAELDNFGYSVALSADGTIVAVSSPFSTVNGEALSGAVRVFQLVENIWVPYGQTLAGETRFDEFGTSVALSADGTVLAVGESKFDLDGERLSDAGKVSVYSMVDGLWTMTGDPLLGHIRNDRFGISVALSWEGNILAVGAKFHDGFWADETGQVTVYRLDESSTWTQIGQEIEGRKYDDICGSSVSLSQNGTMLAFGCSGTHLGPEGPAGDTRILRLIGNEWVPVGEPIVGERPGDWSGVSVRLSGDGTVVSIGAPHHSQVDSTGNVTADVGHVRIFRLSPSGDRWFQIGPGVSGLAGQDYAGGGLAMSSDGTVLAVGAGGHNGNGKMDSGQVRVYELLG